MTNQQKKVITDYLCGPRDHAEGVALYRRFGANLRLKRQFIVDETAVTHEILIDELRRLAGISTAEFLRLPRLAARSSVPDLSIVEEKPEEIKVKPVPGNAVMSETNKKMIRFREKYAFLNSPDCPDVLKVLVADMFTAYGNFKEAFQRLQDLGDVDSVNAAEDCRIVVEEYLKNREIWAELDYYRENGHILGKAAKFREMEESEDISRLSDVELISRLKSAQVQESKNRKKIASLKETGQDSDEAEESLRRWSQKKALLKAEVDRRKKK